MKTILLSTIAVGIIGFFMKSNINSIWFETKTLMTLLDTIVSWGLVGIWLGFWLKKD